MVKKRLMAFALSLCMVLAPVMEASAAGTVSDGDAANSPVTLSEDAASDSGTTVSGTDVPETSVTETDAESDPYSANFEDGQLWGFTGTLIDNGYVVNAAEESGNHYMHMSTTKGAGSTAVQAFENVPDLSGAEVSFDIKPVNLKSDSRVGRPGVRLYSGGTEIVTFYIGEMRADDGVSETSVYYSVYGGDITDSGQTLPAGEWTAITVSVDFTAGTAAITAGGTELAAVEINDAATTVDSVEVGMWSTNNLGSGKTYGADIGFDNFSVKWEETAAANGAAAADFEDGQLWGFTGTLIDNGYVVNAAEESGNHYMHMSTTKGAGSTAVQAFENVPDLSGAEVSFDIKPVNLKSDSRVGRPGVRLYSGGTEIVTFYIGEMRADDGVSETSVYYSVYGGDITDSGQTLPAGEWTAITVSVDFTAGTAAITAGGTELAAVEINAAATTVDSVEVGMWSTNNLGSGKTYSADIGFDNFSFAWESASGEAKKVFLSSVAEFEAVTVTKDEFENGYQHPETVEVTLSDDTTQTVAIDAESWTCDQEVDLDEMGTYTWTAQVVLPDGVTNPLGLTVSYVMDYMSDFLETDINSLGTLPAVNVTKEAWTSGTYAHPTQVAATQVNGRTITVSIDAESWVCEEFDEEVKGSYVWTADIVVPEGSRNHRNLKASYTMNYYGNWVSEHDYEDDFAFGIAGWNVWGKDVDLTSYTGGYDLSLKEKEAGDAYLFGTVEKSGAGRGSRLDLSGDIVKGATMEFDWMPVTVNGGHTDILFMAPVAKQNYFTLCTDSTGEFSYYTTADSNNTDVMDNDFEGVIAEADAVATGVGALNEWFRVKVEFDYINHTAALTVTAKEDAAQTFTQENIPIGTAANGLSLIVVRKYSTCAKSEFGIDNIIVDYEKFGATDIVSVVQPSDVNVAAVNYDEFEYPSEVTVNLGDGSKAKVAVGEWTSDPEFDEKTEAVYAWTASLVTDKYTNYFDLNAAFSMNYTLLPYVVKVNNPSTLELEYGSAWSESELPETATIVLSDGSKRTDAAVGEWTAIRAFDSANEGIYIYGANLAESDEYSVIADKITPNEYHGESAGDALKAEFVYDVYYRISYYTSADNYNAYTRSMEYLDRGVTAVPSGDGILVSWRLLVDEYGTDIQFNVLRNGIVVNSAPITTKTNYLDADGEPGDLYAVQVIKDGETVTTDYVVALEENYMSIPLQRPDPQPDKDGNLATYSINDAGVADVDGDGQYEVVVKWYPSDAFDSGKQDGPSAPTIFDCYELDGTALWRLNMGLECPSGAHWNQFMLYDLDEDGKAEFFIKTSDGTTTYKPNADGLFDMTDASTIVSYIGDPSVIPGTNINSTGHANVNSNEYITVFNGMTGEEIDTIDYVNAVVDFADYGDDWGNRASRFNIAIAYQPKSKGSTETIPTVLFNRGYYEKTTVAAYTLRDGKLQLEWNFDSDDYRTGAGHATSPYAGKGNHNVSTGDMDNDGFDELVIGALAIDHDGSVLWCKDGVDGQDYQGHSDTIHLAAMNPEDPTQLYVFTPSEHTESTLNGTLSNAENGSRINGLWTALADIGRGVAANITPLPGYEYWANTPNNEGAPTGMIFNLFGEIVATTPPSTFSTNWVAYWDGDLLSELADGYNPGGSGTAQTIYKYNWEDNSMDVLAVLEGTHTNNSTKNNPSLTADLFGDWREEFMVGSADDTELRIYMTDYETDYMIYSLMQDPVYRNAVANQNTSYNQPPHVGFYLGEDNKDQVLAMQLPTANIRYTTTGTADESVYHKTEVVVDDEAVNVELEKSVKDKSVQELIGDSTVEALRTYLTDTLVEEAKKAGLGTLTADQVKVLDVKVLVKIGDEDWTEATEETFPENGTYVTIPYPEGTGKDGFDFVISHLKNTGGVADMEYFSGSEITKTDDGLVVRFTSASPVAITWNLAKASTPTPTPDPGTTPTPDPGTTPTPAPGTTQTPAPVTTSQPETPSDSTQESSEEMDHANSFIDTYLRDKDGNIILSVTDGNKAQIIAGKDAWLKLTDAERAIVNNTVGNHAGLNYEDYLEKAGAPFTAEELKQSSVPKTGDHMDTAVIVWIIVLAVAAAGIGVVVVSKRRKKAE